MADLVPGLSDRLGYTEYRVLPRDRQPLLDFILADLRESRCRIIAAPQTADRVPFRITFETPSGERLGVIVYPSLVNANDTRNRPQDEWRFQLKYGSKPRGRPVFAELWRDPYGLYTTLLCGINPEHGFFVGADPVVNSPTRLFISVEFKHADVAEIRQRGWHAWERERRPRSRDVAPEDVFGVQTMVGGTRGAFLRYIRFEREAAGEDPGHRMLLAERFASTDSAALLLPAGMASGAGPTNIEDQRAHQLAREFEMSASEVLDLIGSASRLKMAVRGWVAEHHLARTLAGTPGVTDCQRMNVEGGADIQVRYRGGPSLTVECKNVLRQTFADGAPKLDFQRTRAAKGDPCSRYYAPIDFDVVAACLHAVHETWTYRYALPTELSPHRKCSGKLESSVRIDDRWTATAEEVLQRATDRLATFK